MRCEAFIFVHISFTNSTQLVEVLLQKNKLVVFSEHDVKYVKKFRNNCSSGNFGSSTVQCRTKNGGSQSINPSDSSKQLMASSMHVIEPVVLATFCLENRRKVVLVPYFGIFDLSKIQSETQNERCLI